MKPKNKTKKNKQKGGNPYQLDVEAASIFYLLYSTMMHSRTKEEIEEVNNMIFDFFKKKNDDPVITANTKFITIEDIYERESDLYSNDFKQFISDSKQIFNDTRISDESKYIKISDSFSKLCFDDSFNNKFIKHLVNLRYITLYNHKILLLQLKQCIINMYRIIGNCDAGIIEKNMPIQLRSLLLLYIKNPIINMPISLINFFKTNKSKIEDQISMSNSTPQPTDSIELSDKAQLLLDEIKRTQTSTITLTKEQIEEGKKNKNSIMNDLKTQAMINSIRGGFSLLVNFYKNNNISALDLRWDIESDDVGTAIEKNNTKNSLKNALNAELTRIKILASDPNNTTHISTIVRSLGYGLAPLSLGISLIGGIIIDWVLDKLYDLDIVKQLNENKMHNNNFIESKVSFLTILSKNQESIQPSDVTSCLLNERIDKYTQAYALYNKYIDTCLANYDNYFEDFINFKYIYNLLCDKTKEQIVNYIDSDIGTAADAAEIVVDADKIVADETAANETPQDDVEKKVNKLYARLQRGTCSTRDGVLISYHLKDIKKGFGPENERNEVEKKAILRRAISRIGIIPERIICSNGLTFATFIKNYITPFLDTPTPDIPTPALSTSALATPATFAPAPATPADEWDEIKQYLLHHTEPGYEINDEEVQYALTMLRTYIKNYFKLQNDCNSPIKSKQRQLDPIIAAVKLDAKRDTKGIIKDYLCGKNATGGKKSKHNRKRKTQKQNKKTKKHR